MKNFLSLLFLTFWTICSFAQMQGQFSQSSERSVPIVTPDSRTTKIMNHNDSVIISLCRNNNGDYIFTRSRQGSNQVDCASNNTAKVYFDPDNSVVDNIIYSFNPTFGTPFVLNYTYYVVYYNIDCIN